MPPTKVIHIDTNSADGIIQFKSWITKTFPVDSVLYFSLFRIESITDDSIRLEIAERLETIFTVQNYRVIYKHDEDICESIFILQMNINSSNIILDLWLNFYAVSFFEPQNNLTFEEFEEYQQINNGFNDNTLGQKWLWHQLADIVYIKNLGGEELIISSFKFNA